MKNKILKILFVVAFIFLLFPTNSFAEDENFITESIDSVDSDIVADTLNNFKFEQDIFRAKVLAIIEEDTRTYDDEGDVQLPYQYLKVKALDGKFKGQELEIDNQQIKLYDPFIEVEDGETIVIYWNNVDYPEFSVENKYHLNKILLLVIIFFLLVVALTRTKGIKALISLIITFAILVYIITPQIANGANPIIISLIGSALILAISIFLSHGMKKTSVIAYLSSFLTLIITILISYIAVHYPDLKGFGSDEAFWLNIGNLDKLNLQSLLLTGMVISIVGILDDVTIVQASIIEELHETNKQLGFKELYKKGFNVGREHIISMVNTLLIIYAGVALPILLYITQDNTWDTPFWARLNQEALVEEIARSLAGSTSLLFAVPITTLLAAYTYTKTKTHEDKK